MAGFHDIIGHDDIIRHLKNAIETGKVSHSYIFTGEPGSGKKLLAGTFAAALQCESGESEPCMTCDSCKKVIGKNHPDIITVTHEKPGSISIDEVRDQVVRDVDIKPYCSPYKIYIIPDAEMMTVQAQNALLKLLEEPPENVFLFLLASDPSRLLPTVLSRVQAFRMERLNRCQMEAYFEKDRQAAAISAQNPVRYRQSLLLAGGSVGRARALFSMTPKQYEADAQVAAMRQAQTVLSMLSGMVRSRTALLAFLQDNVADREQCGLLTERLMAAMHDCMLYKKSCPTENFLFFTEPEEAESVSAGITTARAMHCYERLGALRQRLQANLNLNATLCALTMALYDAE